MLASLPFGHTCRGPKTRKTHYVDRIPKRIKKWESGNEDPDDPYIWGIQARYKPCILAIFIIHSLILGSMFGVGGWMQKTHKGSLQDAAVPVTIAAVLLSLFWSTSGVLPGWR